MDRRRAAGPSDPIACGYQISLCSGAMFAAAQRGAVQSVALRLICERQKEIDSFVEEEYWTLKALLRANGDESSFEATLERYRGEKIELPDRPTVDAIIEALTGAPFTVDEVKKSKRRRRPAAPLSPAACSRRPPRSSVLPGAKRWPWPSSSTRDQYRQQTAGLITYMRTDSTRVAAQAQQEARGLVSERFGADYLPSRPPLYRSRKSAQEAHEAIRPTSVYRTPQSLQAYLSRDQARLYRLIWERFVASQMAPAIYDRVRADLSAAGYGFKAVGSKLIFPGFLKVYPVSEKEKEEETVLPPLKKGQELTLVELLPKQHFTQPPPATTTLADQDPREKGIGRRAPMSP